MLDEGQAIVLVNEFTLEAFMWTPGVTQIRTSILESAFKNDESEGIWRFGEGQESRSSLIQPEERPNSQQIPDIFASQANYFPNVINTFNQV
jgi:hypothetical protein